MTPSPSPKGQGALEYLLLIGGAVLIATIVLLIILSSASSTNSLVNTNLSAYQDALANASGVNPPASFSYQLDAPDLPYGSFPEQVFDWYSPSAQSTPFQGPWPVIVWVHGGGFAGGTEDDLSQVGGPSVVNAYLQNGYAFVSVEYRVVPAAYYPDQTYGVARAIQYLRANASQFNIDPNKVIGYGGSAGGAHIGYLAFGPELQDLGSSDPILHESSRPNAYINFRTPTDFRLLDGAVTNGASYFCGSANYGIAQITCFNDLEQFSLLYHVENRTAGSAVPVFSYYTGAFGSGPPFTEVHDYRFGELLQDALLANYGIPVSSPENTFYASLTPGFDTAILAWLADPAIAMNP